MCSLQRYLKLEFSGPCMHASSFSLENGLLVIVGFSQVNRCQRSEWIIKVHYGVARPLTALEEPMLKANRKKIAYTAGSLTMVLKLLQSPMFAICLKNDSWAQEYRAPTESSDNTHAREYRPTSSARTPQGRILGERPEPSGREGGILDETIEMTKIGCDRGGWWVRARK